MSLGENISVDKAISMEDIKKFGEEMRKVDWSDKNQTRAIAQIIVNRIEDEQDTLDLVREFAEVVQFSEGDTMQFATQKGGKAYIHTPGSAAPRSTIVQRVQTVDAELVSVMLEFELDQLRAGRYGNMNTVKNWARRALLYKKYKIVWDTLLGSVTSTAAGYFTVLASASIATKLSGLNNAIDFAEDQIEGVGAIVGRRTDLNFLLRWGTTDGIAYSDRTKDDILQRGILPIYRGIPIVALNAFKDAYNAEMITSGSIMLVNRTTLKVGVNRGLEVLDDLDIDTRIWKVHASEKYGCAVFFPERNAKLVFTG